MSGFVKTVKLRLCDPLRDDREKIREGMHQSVEVANEASKRMPGFPFKYIRYPRAKGSPLYGIVQDLRNNGITLNAACAFEAVEKARESYLAMRQNRVYDGIPRFKSSFVRLHNRYNIGGFFERNDTFYVELRLFPREKIILPFYPGDYQDYFLEKIVNGDMDYGAGEIIRNDGFYTLNLSVKKEVDLDYEPKTFIGVDLGLNVLAWGVALDSGGNFQGEIHFDGGHAGWIRDRYLKKRKRLQREGNLKLVKKIRDRESRWMENMNHVISRRIIDFAEQFDCSVIKLENINLRQMRGRVENPKICSWRAGDLRNMIEYKALEAGILTEEMNPKNTSLRCKECNHVSKENRKGVKFRCVRCGYSNHADFVAAWNIAVKSLPEHKVGEVPRDSKCWSYKV